MNVQPTGLTLKHVDDNGNSFYISAHFAQLVWPTDGRPNYVAFDAGDESNECREMMGGTVYILNSVGKTIDVLRLGQIAPSRP